MVWWSMKMIQPKYRLSVVGGRNPYSSDYLWTLKINRLPDDRSYIVRDISAFLSTVRKETCYQIGKNYFEPLSLLQFDQASQEVIHFLWRLIPDKRSSRFRLSITE